MSAVEEYRSTAAVLQFGPHITREDALAVKEAIDLIQGRADAAIAELETQLAEAHYRIDCMIDDHEVTRTELAALKERRCETCAKCRPQHDDMPTDFCLDIGYITYGIVDFVCNRWEARP